MAKKSPQPAYDEELEAEDTGAEAWQHREEERLRGALIPLEDDHRLRERDGKVHPPRIQLRPEEAEILEDGTRQKAHTLYNDELKQRFIELLSMYGVKHKCAKAVGICPYTHNLHYKKDPEYAEACDLAMEVFRDSIEETIIDRAIHGWMEPLVSGGAIVGYVKKFDNRLLELLAKRHIAAYRDKQHLDVSVSGGVMFAPAPVKSEEDWEQQTRLEEDQRRRLVLNEADKEPVESRQIDNENSN